MLWNSTSRTLFNTTTRQLLGKFFAYNVTASTTMAGNPSKYSVAYVTVPNDEVGKKIAHGLVNNKLAACVNMIPNLLSIYEWEGKINEDPELLLMIKTRTSRLDELTNFVKQNHPYNVCEVISVPIEHGNPPYLDWIGSSVSDKIST